MIDLEKITRPAVAMTSLILAGGLLVVDIIQPTFDAPSVLYQTPIILAAFFNSRHQKILLALTCSAFVLAGYVWHYSFSLDAAGLLPRAVALAGIWTIGLVSLTKERILDQIARRESRLDSLIEERTQNERFKFGKKVELLKTEISQSQKEVRTLMATAQELDNARQQAEDAARARTELLTALSRQFCSPLETIQSMASILNDTPLDREQADYVQTIRSSSRALHKFAQDLQDLPKLEAGTIELEMESFILQSTVEEAIDLVRHELSENQIQLTATIDPALPTTFVSDPNRIRQVLTYLIDVATRFSPGSTLTLTFDAMDSKSGVFHLHGKIHSSQAILTHDEFDASVDMLAKGNPSPTALATDRDLPLYLSARLCKTLKGKVWMEQQQEKELTIHFVIGVEVAQVQQPALSIKPWFKDKHLLVVDDHGPTRDWLSLALKSWGIRSTALGSAPEAIRWIAEGNVCDAILLDFDMPDIDGLTFARQISQKNPGLPILLMTSFGEHITDSKITGSLAKPLKLSQLYYRLSAQLNDRSQPAVSGWYNGSEPEPVETTSFEMIETSSKRSSSNWLSELANYIDEDDS